MELSSEAARTMLGPGPVIPEDHQNLMGQVVTADATVEYPAQQIMFNTKPDMIDDAKRKHDVGTMRISSFMINNNPIVTSVPTSDPGPNLKSSIVTPDHNTKDAQTLEGGAYED